MNRLYSIDQYKELRSKLKSKCKKIVFNVYFLTDEIKRYIEIERAYYVECDDIVFFIFDEEKFYRVCFIAAVNAKGVLPQLDKCCLVRNIYIKERKKEDILQIEKILLNNNFKFAETVICMQIETDKILDNSSSIEFYKSMLVNAGYYIGTANFSMINEIENLIDTTPMIRTYHLDYRTLTEKEKLIAEGAYMVICNPEGKICGVELSTIKNDVGIGEVIIAKDKIAGAASILSLERMKKMKSKGIPVVDGWVLENNEQSVKYHKKLGYTLTDRLVDEWTRNN